jgi:hypothetical protein
VAEKGGVSFSRVVQDGYLDSCGCWRACEIFSDNWFGKPSNTLEPSMWIHIPGSGVMLVLIFGAVVSTVGWNALGLQRVDVIFRKDKCSLL